MQKIQRMKNKQICPVERSGALNNPIRKLLQNPRKILEPFIHPGMTVVDLGCGPGFFTIEIAKMLKNQGKVIAVDLQAGMLEKVRQRMNGFEETIDLHQCSVDKIGLSEKADFILVFYMIHEVPNKEKLFDELKTILKPGGKLLIVEPKFHVRKIIFDKMAQLLSDKNFKMIQGPKLPLAVQSF